MKTIVFILSILWPGLSLAQVAVIDGPLISYLQSSETAKTAQEKANFAKEYQEMLRQGEYLKQQYELLNDVSDGIQAAYQLQNLHKKQQQIIQATVETLDMVSESNFSPSVKDAKLDELIHTRNVGTQIFQQAKDVTTHGLLKMTDGERLTYLDAMDKEASQLLHTIKAMRRKISRLIQLQHFYED